MRCGYEDLAPRPDVKSEEAYISALTPPRPYIGSFNLGSSRRGRPRSRVKITARYRYSQRYRAGIFATF